MTILIQIGEYSFIYNSGRDCQRNLFRFQPCFDDFGYPKFFFKIGKLTLECRAIWLEDYED